MNKPTLDEYNQAKIDVDMLDNFISMCKIEQNAYMDKIIASLTDEARYRKSLDDAKAIVVRYEKED